jgi:hypothetical protein
MRLTRSYAWLFPWWMCVVPMIVNTLRDRTLNLVRSLLTAFFWGTTNITWDLAGGMSGEACTQVRHHPATLVGRPDNNPCRIWKLVPAEFNAGSQPTSEATLVPATGLPPHDRNPENRGWTCSRQSEETRGDSYSHRRSQPHPGDSHRQQ